MLVRGSPRRRFDGATPDAARFHAQLSAQINRLQPRAVVFGGYGMGTVKNYIRWIGSESGIAPADNWSGDTIKGEDSELMMLQRTDDHKIRPGRPVLTRILIRAFGCCRWRWLWEWWRGRERQRLGAG